MEDACLRPVEGRQEFDDFTSPHYRGLPSLFFEAVISSFSKKLFIFTSSFKIYFFFFI